LHAPKSILKEITNLREINTKSNQMRNNTRIVRTNLQDEILALKQEQGKNILTDGV